MSERDRTGGHPLVFMDDINYGNSSVFPARELHIETEDGSGYVETDDVDIARSFRFDPQTYEAAVRSIGEHLMVLEGDEIDGVPTRLGVALTNVSSYDEDWTSRFATGSSSMWNNRMQAAETALRVSDGTPNLIYVDATGQGGSSPWPKEEASYIKKTGRYVLEDGSPLPSIAEKQRILDREGFRITSISSDADGCSFATAHAVAMEPGQLTAAHFNGAPITGDSGMISAALQELVNQLDDLRTDQVSEDPARLTPQMIEMAQELMPERPRAVPAQGTKLEQARTTHTPGKLAVVSAGLSRGGRGEIHPAILDTAEMIKSQPEARILFSMTRRAMSEGELGSFLDGLLRQSGARAAGVSAIHTPGTRRMHKAFPTVRESIRRYHFGQGQGRVQGSGPESV